MRGGDYPNLRPVFKRAQLLQRFRLLETAWLPLYELQQEFRRVAVESLMPVEDGRHAVAANKRDFASREVKRVSKSIDDDFNHVRVGQVVFRLEDTCRGDHLNVAIPGHC